MAESRWIAYELHDGLMQWVIGARMHMASLTAAVKEGRQLDDDLYANLAQILSFLNQATEEGRQLIRFVEGLPLGDQVDVVETLHTTCEMLTRKTVDGRPTIVFHRPEDPWPKLEAARAWPVVRIVQQAVMNAVRHSCGNRVEITLSSQTTTLVVTVVDDGRGFDTTAEYPGHFGLKSMRSRAREAGMQLEIESQTGVGSRVSLHVPLTASAKSGPQE